MIIFCTILGASLGFPFAVGFVYSLIIRSNVYGDKKNEFKDLCPGGLKIGYNRHAMMCGYDKWCQYNGFWAQDPNFNAEPLVNMTLAAAREVPVYGNGQQPMPQEAAKQQGWINSIFNKK